MGHPFKLYCCIRRLSLAGCPDERLRAKKVLEGTHERNDNRMRKYIIKRILLSVMILFCVTFIIYAMLRCLPASYVENMAMQLASKPGAKPYEEWLTQLNASYGLDKEIIPGYLTWLSGAVQGQFGDSWKYTVPVLEKFNDVSGSPLPWERSLSFWRSSSRSPWVWSRRQNSIHGRTMRSRHSPWSVSHCRHSSLQHF